MTSKVAVFAGRGAEADGLEVAPDLVRRQLGAEDGVDPGRAHGDGDRAGKVVGVGDVDDPADDLSPAIRASSWQKRATARSTPSGSTPRSKRTDASERRPSRFDVRAMASGRNQAASRITVVVASEISDDAPPMTPPMPTGAPSASQMRQSSGPTRRSTPSRVTSVSLGRWPRRTSRPRPGRRSRS